MECNIGADYCYLSPGDLMITRACNFSPNLFFPMGHYHGVGIRVDTVRSPRCLSCFLQDIRVQPKAIGEKFCPGENYYIARSNPSFAHIFSELYQVPPEIQQGYYKVKVLELMLFLSALPVERTSLHPLPISHNQAQLAKEVAKYFGENMEQRLTLAQAAKKFHSSPTNIKNSFKAVYGVPYYSFLKAQKMESAAYMLEYTDRPILSIANEHGYENGGKFARAFRSVKGMSPCQYRALVRKS